MRTNNTYKEVLNRNTEKSEAIRRTTRNQPDICRNAKKYKEIGQKDEATRANQATYKDRRRHTKT